MRPALSSLRRINRLQVRQMRRALDPHGYVGVMHLIVLYARKHPGASQEEIACFFGLDKASLARDARRLEERGHIVRRVNEADRRQNQLFLTEAGQAFAHVIDDIDRDIQRRMSAGFMQEEWQTLSALLSRVEQNLTAPR